MDPGALIKLARRRRGLTQAELAARAGTSQPVISAYEHNRRDPTTGTLRGLLAAAGERLDLGLMPSQPEPAPATTPAEHAARLLDVLSLADAIPIRKRATKLAMPRMVSVG